MCLLPSIAPLCHTNTIRVFSKTYPNIMEDYHVTSSIYQS